MKCNTKQEARRIAYFGARKMDGQNYQYRVLDTFKPEADGTLRDGIYWVINPQGEKYRVADSPFEAKRTLECNCPFFADNGVCKHCMRCEWLLTDAEQSFREQEEEHQIAEDATRFMEACRIERGQ